MTTRIIMRNDGRATAEGETEIFGTSGRQTVTVLDGASVTFRSGFNSGGDIIRLNGRASDFTASISGSNVTLRSAVDNITIVIPIGSAANTITFDNGDSRSLSLVGGVPMLGGQMIGIVPTAVTAGPGTFTITGAASVTEGNLITYTVTRTDTTSAETLLFSVDGSTNGGIVTAATQGADFSPASGVITFAAGAATATFTVAASSDTLVEGLEGISVRVLSGNRVVAETNATIIDGASQGQNFTLSAGTDTVPGTGGNDTITGRISDFQSFDTVTGGAGIDTLVLTGALPTDANAVQPAGVVDGAFAGTTGVERLIMAGGTPAQSSNATLGALARAAGLTEVVAGGTGAQAQVIDVVAFDGALTVSGSANDEVVNVSLATSAVADNRAKTLNLGAGVDVVNVATPTTAAGSVAVNFVSATVGNNTDDNVRIGGGSVVVNDEGTRIVGAGTANVFNVVGLSAATGMPAVDANGNLTENRGNFNVVELGTNAAETFTVDTAAGVYNGRGNVYINAGAGNDSFMVTARAGERHFMVGGAGDDRLNAEASAGGTVVALMGGNNDSADVRGAGSFELTMGDGADTVTAQNVGMLTANLGTGENSATVSGTNGTVSITAGDGVNTIAARAATLSIVAGNGGNAITISGNGDHSVTTGNGADTIIVGAGNGDETINAGGGDDLVAFRGGSFNTKSTGADTLDGGDGFDTLAVGFGAALINATASGSSRVTGFEALTIDAGNGAIDAELRLSGIQSGLTVVNAMEAFEGAGRIVFDASSATLNLGVQQFAGETVQVESGTGLNDTVTINSTIAAGTNGVAVDAFAGADVSAIGVERLVVNTSAAGTASTQTFGNVRVMPSATGSSRVEFVGSNSVDALRIDASAVDASGLTGSANIAAETSSVNGSSFVGSANGDNVLLGTGRGSVDLGAGNDVLVIRDAQRADLNAGLFDLEGGEGVDTLQMSSAAAAQLSNSVDFLANTSGFEWLSIDQTVAQRDVIRVDNLGVGRVISAGTAPAPAPTAEVVTFKFSGNATGADSVTFDGRTVTFAEGNNPITQAFAFASALGGIGVNASGSNNWRVTSVAADGTVTLTSKTTGDVADLTSASFIFANGSTVGAPAVTVAAPVTQGRDEVAATKFKQTLDLTGVTYNVDSPANGGQNNFVIGGRDANNNSIVLTISSGADLTNATLINLIVSQVQGDPAFNAAYDVSVVGTQIVFEAKATGARTPLLLVDNGNDGIGGAASTGVLRGNANFVTPPTSLGSPLEQAVKEVFDATFTGMTSGRDTVAFDGVTVTLDSGLSAAQAATQFVSLYNNATSTKNFIAADQGNGVVRFTALVAGARTDVVSSNFVVTDQQGLTVPSVVIENIVQGTTPAAGEVVIQNLASGRTLELTGGGIHTVNIAGAASSTTDVLNLELNIDGGINFGTVNVANVERVNVITRDSGVGTAASQDAVSLVASGAREIFVTGNNGVVFSGSGTANVTLFDASGVVGNSMNDTAAHLGVVYDSANNTAGASVTIRGGAGDDMLRGGRANDTFDLSVGGRDTVALERGREAGERDVINAFTGGATSTNANADVLGLESNSGAFARLVDANGGAGLIFNATPSNATPNNLRDLEITDTNNNFVYLVTDGNALLNIANVKDITANSAQSGEILIGDGASAYVLHASSAASNVVNIYRVFDADTTLDIRAEVELLGTINLTNTFGDLTGDNFDTPAPIVVQPAPAPVMMAAFDSFNFA